MIEKINNFCSFPGFYNICEYLEVDKKKNFKLIWNKLFIFRLSVRENSQSRGKLQLRQTMDANWSYCDDHIYVYTYIDVYAHTYILCFKASSYTMLYVHYTSMWWLNGQILVSVFDYGLHSDIKALFILSIMSEDRIPK